MKQINPYTFQGESTRNFNTFIGYTAGVISDKSENNSYINIDEILVSGCVTTDKIKITNSTDEKSFVRNIYNHNLKQIT